MKKKQFCLCVLLSFFLLFTSFISVAGNGKDLKDVAVEEDQEMTKKQKKIAALAKLRAAFSNQEPVPQDEMQQLKSLAYDKLLLEQSRQQHAYRNALES